MVKGKRKAEIELTLKDKTAAALHGAARNLRKFATSTPKSIAKGVGRASMAIGKSLLTGFGMRGADMLTDAFGGLVDIERNLTRFQIASSSSDEEMQKMRASLLEVSNAAGISRTEILAGAQAYVAFTGDGKGAVGTMKLFADVANATGASMADISGVAGAFIKNMKIDPSQFREGFDILTTQGKAGAVEIRDLASEISNVAPMFARFAEGSGLDGLAKMGAIMQVMRTEFGSVEETATGFKGVMSQLMRKSSDLKKMGINVFGSNKKPLEFLQIVGQISNKVKQGKLNDAMLIDLLGEQKAVNALNATMNGTNEIQKMVAGARASNAIQKDSAAYQLSTAGRLDKVWTNIKNKIAEVLTPERIQALASALVKVADLFAGLVEKISQIIGFITDHLPSQAKAAKETQAETADYLASTREDRIKSLQLGVSDMHTMTPTDKGPMSRDAAINTLIGEARGEQSAFMRRNEGGTITSQGDDTQGLGHYNAYVDEQIALRQMQKKPRNSMAENSSMLAGMFQPQASQSFADASSKARTPQTFGQYPVFDVTLKIGETTFARAMANDPSQRRKPGGM